MLKDILLVGAGGFAGSILRFLLSYATVAAAARIHLPVGTLLVNILGAFIIGLLFAVLKNDGWYYLLVTGFCGGFTTFSTFSLEAVNMLREGNYKNAVIYIIISVILCLLFTLAGYWVGGRFAKATPTLN